MASDEGPLGHSPAVLDFTHRRRDVLAREGIGTTATSTLSKGTLTFGPERRRPRSAPAGASRCDVSSLLLGRANVTPTRLADGWVRLSRAAAGTVWKCGLHTVVEGVVAASQDLVAVFLPRTGKSAALLSAPSVAYDILVDVKVVKGTHPDCAPGVLLGSSRTGSAFVLRLSALERKLQVVLDDACVAEVPLPQDSLRANFFSSLVVRVREHDVSVQIDDVAVLRNLTCRPRLRFNANQIGDGARPTLDRVGFVSKGDKFVYRNWRLQAPNPSREAAVERRSAKVRKPQSQPEMSDNHDEEPVQVDAEDQRLTGLIEGDIIDGKLGVSMDSIVGLATAKRLLHEAIVLPLLVPELFEGVRQPWSGVLLFGPPGSGKTMLAKAIAGLDAATFFNLSTASLISKYRGESEKILRCLFSVAKRRAPSVVFVDEIDALVSKRGSSDEHEASRRLKAEFLMHMDGMHTTQQGGKGENRRVLLLATTNCPWDLDEALLRRLEKRIYVPLPSTGARKLLFEKNLLDVQVDVRDNSALDYADLAHRTEGYSCSDVVGVCREAAFMPLRRLAASQGGVASFASHRPETENEPWKGFPIREADLLTAIKVHRRTVKATKRYDEWNRKLGSG